MGALVASQPKRLFVTSADVMAMLGCKHSYAGKVLRDLNTDAKEAGKYAFPSGKANKYQFAEKYGIPIDEVEKVIAENGCQP